MLFKGFWMYDRFFLTLGCFGVMLLLLFLGFFFSSIRLHVNRGMNLYAYTCSILIYPFEQVQQDFLNNTCSRKVRPK